MKSTVVIIPAYNEESAISSLMDELNEHVPFLDVVVINDGSVDNTADLARKKGAIVLDLPCNLGVGGSDLLSNRKPGPVYRSLEF